MPPTAPTYPRSHGAGSGAARTGTTKTVEGRAREIASAPETAPHFRFSLAMGEKNGAASGQVHRGSELDALGGLIDVLLVGAQDGSRREDLVAYVGTFAVSGELAFFSSLMIGCLLS